MRSVIGRIAIGAVLGGVLGTLPLGFYSVGMQVASLPMQRINGILNQVAFPAFAAVQDDPDKIRRYLRKAFRVMGLFAFPVFFGIAVVAPDEIRIARAVARGSRRDDVVARMASQPPSLTNPTTVTRTAPPISMMVWTISV